MKVQSAYMDNILDNSLSYTIHRMGATTLRRLNTQTHKLGLVHKNKGQSESTGPPAIFSTFQENYIIDFVVHILSLGLQGHFFKTK